MIKIKNDGTPVFQGDLAIRAVSALPDQASKSDAQPVIVAHSETGHHHVVVGDGVTLWNTDHPLLSFLVVRGEATLEHQRAWDTHDPIRLDSGDKPEVIYEIRRQREHSPDGWRRVQD